MDDKNSRELINGLARICRAVEVNLKRLHLLLFVLAFITWCSVGSLTAQKPTTELIGNWAYSLGSKTLFGLHLEDDPMKPGQLRGYVMTPKDFNINLYNGTLLQFSKIMTTSDQTAVVSLGWKDGALQLTDPHPTHGADSALTCFAKPIDASDLDLTLFPGFPASE